MAIGLIIVQFLFIDLFAPIPEMKKPKSGTTKKKKKGKRKQRENKAISRVLTIWGTNLLAY